MLIKCSSATIHSFLQPAVSQLCQCMLAFSIQHRFFVWSHLSFSSHTKPFSLIPTHQMMSCLLSKSASAFKCLYVWSQLLNTLRNTHNLISERILVWMKGRNQKWEPGFLKIYIHICVCVYLYTHIYREKTRQIHVTHSQKLFPLNHASYMGQTKN